MENFNKSPKLFKTVSLPCRAHQEPHCSMSGCRDIHSLFPSPPSDQRTNLPPLQRPSVHHISDSDTMPQASQNGHVRLQQNRDGLTLLLILAADGECQVIAFIDWQCIKHESMNIPQSLLFLNSFIASSSAFLKPENFITSVYQLPWCKAYPE